MNFAAENDYIRTRITFLNKTKIGYEKGRFQPWIFKMNFAPENDYIRTRFFLSEKTKLRIRNKLISYFDRLISYFARFWVLKRRHHSPEFKNTKSVPAKMTIFAPESFFLKKLNLGSKTSWFRTLHAFRSEKTRLQPWNLEI